MQRCVRLALSTRGWTHEDHSGDERLPEQTAYPAPHALPLKQDRLAQATVAGMNANLGQSPDQLSRQLDKTLADKLLTEAKGEVYSLFGILPGLTNPATTGPLVREAQRHLAQLVLQPIANLMAEEATEKLGGTVTLDVVRPMQAMDHGGKARAFATMLQAMAQAKQAGLNDATVKDALTFFDWAE